MSERQTATTILMVRHAEVKNPGEVLYGRLPRFGLSDRGRTQAETVAAFLVDRPVAAVYTSPLLRARQTARIIARDHSATTLHRSSLLHEVRSAWEGTAFAAFERGFSTYASRRAADDESIEDIRRRMVAFVERVRRRHPGESVVAVSHGDPITILRLALTGQPITLAAMRGSDYADLCSVTEIVLSPDEAPRVSYLPVPGLAACGDDAGEGPKATKDRSGNVPAVTSRRHRGHE